MVREDYSADGEHANSKIEVKMQNITKSFFMCNMCGIVPINALTQ